jgi:uncharacterized membrane protein YccC
MLAYLLIGALLGAIAGCLITFAWQAWKRRRFPSRPATHVTNVFNWTDKPIAKGRR